MASNEGSQDLLPKYAEKKIQKRRYEPETVDPGTKISRGKFFFSLITVYTVNSFSANIR